MDEQDPGETRACPLCAEPVGASAAVCPHCRGRLKSGFFSDTYRNRPGRQIAGVAVALAETLGVSVTFVRLVFIVLTFINLIGPVVYVLLWLVLPAESGGASPLGRLFAAAPGEDGERSILERLLAEIRGLHSKMRDAFRSHNKEETKPPEGPSEAAEGTP